MQFDKPAAPFVIITPAHNEEAFIEKTIRSMINQTVRPLKWIIVNDSSTDRTAEIIEHHARHCDFVRLVHVRRSGDRNFSNKVRAFNCGLTEARELGYQYIGNLDADISLEEDYFEKLLYKFETDSHLGLAGGMVSTCIGNDFVSQDVALDSVAGAVQLFRRECFEHIGGYLALPQGGIDAAAEITARMKGWKVCTFPELRVLEHRRTGSSKASPLLARIQEGRRFYSLGYSLLFFCLRCIYRAMNRPRIVGSGAALCGFLEGMFRRNPLVLPPEIVHYLRAEQRRKLLRKLIGSR